LDHIQKISNEIGVSVKAILKVISLLNEGATIPFIARYRKEVTGNLDEVQLSSIKERNQYWIEFDKRKLTIITSIEEQGLLTAELKSRIERCLSLTELEDLYLPYKPKRKSKGQKAIELGLKPLAILIQKERSDDRIEQAALQFCKGEVLNTIDALEGAVNILAEWISENLQVREKIRDQFKRYAITSSKVKKGKKESGEKYRDYFAFSESTNTMAAHRVLALYRAEKEGILNISIDVDEEKAIQNIAWVINRNYARNSYSSKAIKEAYKRVLQPSFESELKKESKEKADRESIKVFAENLKQLLLQSPLGSKNIVAIDPGFRTGCKVAVLNRNGDFVSSTTIFPHPPKNNKIEASKSLKHIVDQYSIEAIAVGNGTAGLETEIFCKELFEGSKIQVFSVNEAGASIYSASEIAREEFPELDLTIRGAISIGRRLMDPLAELVKIDAKSIGVGQYQHDVNQVLLKDKLGEVVEHCVNHVGVELNTASYPILSYVSGLGPTLAKNIVEYRIKNGAFKERKQLLKVAKLGGKTFEQAAGFLRIENGKNPLDNTIIHPESYSIAQELAKDNNCSINDLLEHRVTLSENLIQVAKEKYNAMRIDFIVKELQKPTRDPRSLLTENEGNEVRSIEELEVGMVLNGSINNITNFGAFVNIGIKESGLVHVSEISNTFVQDIQEVLSLNQQVKVKVITVDIERKRVALSMKQV
jgi:uncharacterized protein